jgi:hypothetical protein
MGDPEVTGGRAWGRGVALVMIAVGCFLLPPAFGPSEGSSSGTIAAGPDESYEKSVFIVRDHEYGGTFCVSGAGEVALRVYDAAHWVQLHQGGSPTPIFSKVASCAPFAFQSTEPGRYYLVFGHAPGSESSLQTVRLTYEIDKDLLVPIVGFIVAAAGAFLYFWAAGNRPEKPPPD